MILADTSAWVQYDRATGSVVHRRVAELIATDGPLSVTDQSSWRCRRVRAAPSAIRNVGSSAVELGQQWHVIGEAKASHEAALDPRGLVGGVVEDGRPRPLRQRHSDPPAEEGRPQGDGLTV